LKKNLKKNRLLENYYKLPKGQRIQLKKYLCILAVAFLLFLLFLNLLHSCGREGTDTPEMSETSPQHIPVVQKLKNVWITDAEADRITIFCDGEKETFFLEAETEGSDSVPAPEQMREQLADVELTDELVSAVVLKTDKFTGRVLSANENGIEIEGRGRIPLAEDYKGYRLYRELTMCTFADLTFGYANADFIQENGEICGILLAREANMEDIRVLIKTSDYVDILHTEVILTANSDFLLQYGSGENIQEELFPKGDKITIDMDSDYFVGERISIVPAVLTGRIQLLSVNRSQGIPSYRGHIELLRTAEGIAVVNELPLEEYLFSVVPSEMPASYPLEALKAQAICARTYAYGHMLRAGYPRYGAHVDDSTSYQVYNNITEADSTTTAVKETYGQMILTDEGIVANTYYYSTSCGVGTTASIWKTSEAQMLDYLKSSRLSQSPENPVQTDDGAVAAGSTEITAETTAEELSEEESFRDFITQTHAEDYEAQEGWYRWTYTVKEIDVDRILETLKNRYEANGKLILTLKDGDYSSQNIKNFSKVTDITIVKRGPGGVADELVIATDKGTYKIISEYNIRAVLCDGVTRVVRQDGSEVSMPSLLPSAFFVIEPSHDKKNMIGYNIIGGGFGHGVGMSQNGAKNMALQGLGAEQILNFFYEGCKICSEQ
jgi:stage II sporulation protein D